MTSHEWQLLAQERLGGQPGEPVPVRVLQNAIRFLADSCASLEVAVREACRRRTPLDGADAQALEHALTITERERDAARQERDALRVELDRFMREVRP